MTVPRILSLVFFVAFFADGSAQATDLKVFYKPTAKNISIPIKKVKLAATCQQEDDMCSSTNPCCAGLKCVPQGSYGSLCEKQ